jgi:glycine cleavage system aminomethyltransferase T
MRKDLIEVGRSIDVQIGDEQVRGEVVAHPVYDKERRRVKES